MTGLAASLARLDDARLGALFQARPDLLVPAPRDFADVVARAGRQQSLMLAVGGLDRFAAVVLEAIVWWDQSGGKRSPLSVRDGLAQLVGSDGTEVEGAVQRLEGLGLVCTGLNGVMAPAANISSVLAGPLLSLGPSLAPQLNRHPVEALRAIAGHLRIRSKEAKPRLVETIAEALSRPGAVASLVARLPREAAALLRDTDRQMSPVVHMPWPWEGGVPRSTGEHLACRGLIVPLEWGLWVVPVEVSIVLRDGHLAYPVPTSEPPVEVAAAPIAAVESVATDAATRVLRELGELLGALDAKPAAVLKQGGVGVQQVKRLAKRIEVEERRAGLELELAYGAGLVGIVDGEVVPTGRADEWLDADLSERWVRLVEAWLAMPRYPSLAGEASAQTDRPIPALLSHPGDGDVSRSALVGRVLGAGDAAVGVAGLTRALGWRYPHRFDHAPAPVNELAAWTIAEGRLLGALVEPPGLPGYVAAAPIMAALVNGCRDDALSVARKLLPSPVERFTVQADSTVIVPGELQAGVARVLGDLADRESVGAASVWRVSDASVARAMDRGHHPDALLAFLEDHATHGVPQSVRYLIGDLGRRHGRVRVAPAMTVLHGTDAALLAEVQAHRRCARLSLRAVAPTVLVSAAPQADVIAALREAGFLPAAEGHGGTLAVDRPTRTRAEPSRYAVLTGRQPVTQRSRPADLADEIAAAVGRLRAAPPPLPTPQPARQSPTAPPRRPSAPLPGFGLEELEELEELLDLEDLEEVDEAPAARRRGPLVSSSSRSSQTTDPWELVASIVGAELDDPAAMRAALMAAATAGALVEVSYVNGKGEPTVLEALPLDVGEHDLRALGPRGQQTYLLDRLRSIVVLDDGSDDYVDAAEGW